MTFKQEYGKIYGQVWDLHRKHFGISDSDQAWDSLLADVDQLYKPYRNTPYYEFVKKLVLAVLGEIEDSIKRRQREVRR